ncbi:GSCOCG00012061001-RA-CDS, partial [Cotesia congregata]
MVKLYWSSKKFFSQSDRSSKVENLSLGLSRRTRCSNERLIIKIKKVVHCYCLQFRLINRIVRE